MYRKYPRCSTSETGGEALFNCENKVILATKTGDLRHPFVLS